MPQQMHGCWSAMSKLSTHLNMLPPILWYVLLRTPFAYNIRHTTRLAALPSTPHALAMPAPDNDSSCTACKLYASQVAQPSAPSFECQAAHNKLVLPPAIAASPTRRACPLQLGWPDSPTPC
jgi:hypothetical protein